MQTAQAVLPKAAHRIPDEIFALFAILKAFLHRRGGDLSGGRQQQLSITRTMLMKPRVPLLDEPTEGTQPNIIRQIGRVTEYLKGCGDIAIVLVEQHFDFAHGLGDRFHVLKRGAVALSGTKGDLGHDALRATKSV